MESLMKPVYAAIPAGISVTTLASPGDLSIQLTYQGSVPRAAAEMSLDGFEEMIREALSPWIYSQNGDSLEAVVGSLLKKKGKTVACAESCTGGLLGHRLTGVPGSSSYFLESAVVYSNAAKTRRLGVPEALLAKHGAVSAASARAMAIGIRKTARSDIGLSVTGVAGPGGGTTRKPVGLVYIALAHNKGVAVTRNHFFGGRSQVKVQSSQKALDVLRKFLIKGT
jgi:nicotinamide-nucleotide amidase